MNVDQPTVTPLIEGEKCFSALYDAIKLAKTSVMMAYWTVDPDMGVNAEAGGENKGKRWVEFLTERATDGIKVSII